MQAHILSEILEGSTQKYSSMPAVRWLQKKEISERTYSELDAARLCVKRALAKRGF